MRARVSRQVVSRLELNQLDGVGVRRIDRVAQALEATLRIDLEWAGAELDRLLDAGHATLTERVADMLTRWGWQVLAEASFNIYGDRGRYDLLAFHPRSGVLLVVEIKTAVGDLQETLGRLDVKVRVAPRVARERGWAPKAVVAMIVLGESTTARRHVERHPTIFNRLPLRGRLALTWLRRPMGTPGGLLVLLKSPDSRQAGTNSRVRPGKAGNARVAGMR